MIKDNSLDVVETKVSSKSKEYSSSSFDDMILLYRRFFQFIAILPFEGLNFTRLTSRLHLAYCFISTFFCWTSNVVYMINQRKELTVEIICETVIMLGVCIRYYLLLLGRLEFANLLDESRAIWDMCDEDSRRTVRQFEWKIRMLFKIVLSSCICISILYCISAGISTHTAIRRNETQTRFLPARWFSENGPNLWPGYKIIFVIQVVLMQNGGVIATSVDTAGPLLIMIAAGYFRALADQLLRIAHLHNKDHSSNHSASQILAWLRLHQRILKFCSRIEKIMRTLFFVQLLCTSYNTSLIGIKLAGSDPDRYKYVPLVLLNLSQLFICQWAPDHLMEESREISTIAYFTYLIWTKHRLDKLLVLVIARSQQPVQMTAAGVVILSIEKFGSMLISAFSFFTVLRNFNV